MPSPDTMIAVSGLAKTFTLHTRGGVRIPVLQGVDFTVARSECIALDGPSGVGKSTLLRCLYGNYLAQAGSIRLRHDGELVELVGAPPHTILDVRRRTAGYVSQFLRALPRVPTLSLIVEAAQTAGLAADEAQARAERILARLNIGERLWQLPPATFSGGEQQRVNIARTLVVDYPILLLDEPTASLDAANRAVVVELVLEARARGCAIVGIFHDAAVRGAVASRLLPLAAMETAA